MATITLTTLGATAAIRAMASTMAGNAMSPSMTRMTTLSRRRRRAWRAPVLAAVLLEHLTDRTDDVVGVGGGERLQRRTERDGDVGTGDSRDRGVQVVEAILHDDPGQPGA